MSRGPLAEPANVFIGFRGLATANALVVQAFEHCLFVGTVVRGASPFVSTLVLNRSSNWLLYATQRIGRGVYVLDNQYRGGPGPVYWVSTLSVILCYFSSVGVSNVFSGLNQRCRPLPRALERLNATVSPNVLFSRCRHFNRVGCWRCSNEKGTLTTTLSCCKTALTSSEKKRPRYARIQIEMPRVLDAFARLP